MITFISVIFYSFVGFVLLTAAYKAFDLTLPFDLSREIADKNTSAGLCVAGLFIALGIIIGQILS